MIPIKIKIECRCPKCDDYITSEELFILKEDEVFTLNCDYCYCELFSIENKNFKGEEKNETFRL